MRDIVFFDLDGVLIGKQSQKLLLYYFLQKKKISKVFFMKVWAWFILYKLGVTDMVSDIREYALGGFRGWEEGDTSNLIKNFYEIRIKPLLRKKALSILDMHKKNNDEIVLLSASLLMIVKLVSEDIGIRYYFGTKLQNINGVFTGKIEGIIPYGNNKLMLAKDFVSNYYEKVGRIWVYADHFSDLPLLEWASIPCVVNPDRNLKNIAKRRGWRIYEFS